MQGDTQKNLSPEIEINGSASSNPNAGLYSASQRENSEIFYEKLNEFYESSGLSLLFNFRETMLDLYLLFKEVTERGGFHQVTKDGRWADIVSALNLKSSIPKLPLQLQKLYVNLLYKFEQIYFYRTPAKLTADPCNTFCIGDSSTRKRNWDCFSQLPTYDSTIEDAPMEKRQCKNIPFQMSTGLSTYHSTIEDVLMEKRQCKDTPFQKSTGSGTAEQRLRTSTRNKDKKDPDAPLGLRTPYQIFLRKECIRLKEIHGESLNGQNVRKMAIDAWRYLSESDRQPYIEESRKDKERYNQEMTAYKERRNMQCTRTENQPCNSKAIVNHHHMPLPTAGDYHVPLLSDAENFLAPEQPVVELAIKWMKNEEPNDPLYQINWDDCCVSLDIPDEESERL